MVHDTVQGVAGLLAWMVNTVASGLIGLLVGAVVVAVWHVLPLPGKKKAAH